ncbi:MAG: hypothetical protein AB7E55_03240 [Pigmentiphaga sp.]
MSLKHNRYLAALGLRDAYRRTFEGSDGERVLLDLLRFCKVSSSGVAVSRVTGQVDPLASMVAEGRREVYFHIAKILRMTDEQINNLMERERNE